MAHVVGRRPTASGVQHYGCAALFLASSNNAENKVKIAAAGGIEALVRALTAHPNVEVVASLAARAKDLSRQMQSKLFSRLRQGLQLPECLRIVGYLRRMGTHTESGLREEYLECRDGWFQELVDGLPRHDHYGFVKRLTDYLRVHLFDVVVERQYRDPLDLGKRIVNLFPLVSDGVKRASNTAK